MIKIKFLILFIVFIHFPAFSQCGDYQKLKSNPAEHLTCLQNYQYAYKIAFTEEGQGPIKNTDTMNIHFFDIDPNWLIEARYELIENADILYFETSSEKKKQYKAYAMLYIQVNEEKEFTLIVYESEQLKNKPEYADYLFLPFTDLTNGVESYGGGRYLDIKKSDFKDNKLWIDFNKAYNPYCAYSGGYSCPIPPKNNRIKIGIYAGEKNYTGKIYK